MKKMIFTLILAMIANLATQAADYYWVGGSGNWSDFAAHWATASGGATFHTQAPTQLDNVFFDSNSFTAAGQNVTINVDAICSDMNWTGVTNSPQLAGATARKLSVYGSLTLVAAMNYNFLGEVYFESLNTGRTLTSAGQIFKRNVYFQGVGGYILQDAFEQTGSYSVFLNNGTLDLNNQPFKVNIFNTYNTNVRTFLMKSSEMIITSSSNDAFSFRGENLTLNAGTSTIRFITGGANMNHVSNLGSGQTFYDVIFEAVTGTSAISNSGGSFNSVIFNSTGSISTGVTVAELTFNGNGSLSGNGHNIAALVFNANATIGGDGTYGTLTMNGSGTITGSNTIGDLILTAGKSYTFSSGRTQLITGTLTADGSNSQQITIQSNSLTAQTAINKAAGAVTINYCLLQGINSSGGATFTANNSISLGNNSGWTINQPAPLNLYWVGGAGNWNDPAKWSLEIDGAGGDGVPNLLDNVFFTANSFTASGQTVTILGDESNRAYCNNMTWSGITNNPTLGGLVGQTLRVYGSFTLSANMNYTFAGPIHFEAPTTGKNIFTAGKVLTGNVYFKGAGGGWTLMDEFNIGTRTIFLECGTLNTNNQNIVAGVFNSNFSGNTRGLNFGSSEVVLSSTSNETIRFHPTGMAFNAGTSLIRFTGQGAGIYNITGSGLAFHDVVFEALTGTVDVYNNGSFHDIVFNSAGSNRLRYGNTVNSVIFYGTGQINDNGNNITTVAFYGPGTINGNGTYGHVTMNANGAITGDNSFGTLVFAAGNQYTLTSSKTQTILNDLIAEGTETEIINIISNSAGNVSTFFKNGDPVVVSYVSLKDNAATGNATFTANNSIDLGNTPGWIINAPGGKNFYWIGGTGNWDNPANWSLSSNGLPGSAIPTVLDNVFFDEFSFDAPGQVVTLIGDASNNVRFINMDWTGSTNNPTLAGAAGVYLRIHGSLKLIPNMTFSFLGPVYFHATETGQTITTAGIPLDKNTMYFDGEGGGWTLQDGLNIGTRTLHLVRGTLNTNNYPITAGIFNSNYSGNTRALNLGSSEVVLSSTSNEALRFHPTGMTLNAGTSLIRFTGQGAGIYNITGSGLAFHDVIFEAVTGTVDVYNNGSFNNIEFISSGTNRLRYGNTVNSVIFNGSGNIYDNNNNINTLVFNGDGWIRSTSVTTNNVFGHVTMNGNGIVNGSNEFGTLIFSAGKQYTLQNGRTQTILSDLTANGTETEVINIISSTANSVSTFSKASGTVSVEYVSLKDNEATGGATFIANNSIDLGNNSGWIINAPGGKDFYWIGGTGNWDNPANWSVESGGDPGSSIPTVLDNVFFDEFSFDATDQVVTLIGDPSSNVRFINMDWTGATNNPTLAGATGVNLRIQGSLKLIPDMTFSFLGPVYFQATEPAQTITTAGVALDKNNLHFDGVGGEWILQDALNIGTKILYLINGTLNANNHNMEVNQFQSNYNGNPRGLILGSSVITITSTSNSAMYINGNGFNLDAGTSLIRFTAASTGMYNINGGGLFFNDVIFEATTGTIDAYNLNGGFNNITFNSNGTNRLRYNNTVNNVYFNGNGTNEIRDNCTINYAYFNGNGNIFGNNTFGTLEFTPGFIYTLTASRTQIIQNNLIAQGTCAAPITIKSSTAVQTTISSDVSTIEVNQVSLQGLNAIGSADFIAYNAIDLGNNTNWTFAPITTQNLYWVGGTGNWSDVSHWAAASGGDGGYCLPTQLDNVVFDENSFTQGGQAVYIDVPNPEFRDMDWSAATFNPTFTSLSNTYNLNIYGSLILNPEMNFAFSGDVYFLGETPAKSTYEIKMEGNSFNNEVYFNGIGGVWTLMDAFTISSNDLYFNHGTLNTNDQTVSVRRFLSNNNNARALNLGASIINISYTTILSWHITGANFSLDAGASQIRLTSANGGLTSTGVSELVYHNVLYQNPGGSATLSSDDAFNEVIFNPTGTVAGGANINSLTFNSNSQIQGNNTFGEASLLNNTNISGNNTFETLNLTPGRTYQFAANSTQTILNDLNFWGNSDNQITLQSLTLGVQANILKADGIVSGNYIILRDMNATGGATFNVYNSTDISNNTGWNFLEPPFATCPENFDVCANVDPFELNIALPLGWDYSGEGVYYDAVNEVYMFDPALVVGVESLVTYTIGGLFPGSCDFTITILPLPVAVCPDDMFVCEGDDYIQLYDGQGNFYYNGEWIAGFNPSIAGTYTIVYTLEINECGEDSCEFLIEVLPLPDVGISGDLEFCEGQSTTLTATEGTSYEWSTGEITQSVTVFTAGDYSVVVTDANGCEGFEEVSVSYFEITVPTCPLPINLIVSDPPYMLTGGLPEGGTYSGVGVTNNIFDPAAAGIGNFPITYLIQDVCGPQSCEFTIIVSEEPITCEDAIITNFPATLNDVCFDEIIEIDFTGVIVANAIQQIWTVNPVEAGMIVNNIFNLDPAYLGEVTITLLAVAEDPCLDAQASVGFTVKPLPNYFCEFSAIEICSGEEVTFTHHFEGVAPWTLEYYLGGVLLSFTTSENPYVVAQTFTETTYFEPVHIYSGNGCDEGVSQFTVIEVNPLPSYTYELSATEVCSGEEITYTNHFTGTPPWTVVFMYNGVPDSFTTSDNPEYYTEVFTETILYAPVSVTDGNGCVSLLNNPATINVNPLPTFTTELSALEVCYGETVEFTNYFTGTPPWTVVYEYNGVQDSFTTSDNPDYYSEVYYETTINEIISVTDGNGCVTYYVDNITTITVYPLPIVEINGDLQFCEGLSTILTATEGASYEWSTGESTQSITVSVAGDYSVIVTDENGCEGFAEVSVSYLEITIPTCPGNMNVLLTDAPFTLTGGLPEGGTYSGVGVSGNIFNPVTAGVGTFPITYLIEDICGPQSCEFMINVTEEPILCEDASISNFPASAEDVCEGEAYTIDFSGIVIENAIEVIWTVNPIEAGAVVGNLFTLDSEYVGNVTINLLAVAEDPCIDAAANVGFTVNPLPTFSREISDTEICAGEEVTITDYFTGAAPWEVEILQNGQTIFFTVEQSPAIRVRTYTETTTWEIISVTDGKGCTIMVNEVVTITVFPLPSYHYELSDTEICSGDEVVYTNYFTGTAPWTVEFYSNGELMSFTTSENPQTYTETLTETTTFEPVSVTDGNGCSSPVDQPVTITVNPLPTIATDYSSTEVCYGETVEFTNYFTGTPPWTVVYEYNGAQDSFTTSDNPDYYSEIFYETTVNEIISVTDGNGCATYYVDNVTTITVYPLPIVEINGDLQFCEGQSTVLTASEGSSYDWNTGEATQSITVSIAGDYSVIVTDENGCEGFAVVTVSYLEITIPTCPGSMNVLVTDAPFALTGGLPEGGTYSGVGISGNIFSPATAGVGNFPITYLIEDVCGPQSCEFMINVTEEPILCEDASISNFPASAEDVCENEEYTIDFSGVVIENAESEIWTVNPIEAGAVVGKLFTLNFGFVGDVTISLLAVAEDPCEDAQASVGFTVYPLPEFTFEVSDTEVCFGDEVTFTDHFTGTAPWTVSLMKNGTPVTFVSEETILIHTEIMTQTTVYETLSVTDGTGCTNPINQTLTITVNPLPTFSFELSSTVLCYGDELIWTEYFTGTPPWTVEFLFNGEPDSFISYDNPEIFTEIVTESFTFEPLTVTDGNGCTAPVNQPVAITVNPLPTFEFEVSETEICAGEPVVFTNYFTGQAPWTVAYTYNGVPGSFTTSENPEFFTEYFNETTTYITQLITDGNGCSAEINQEVTITVIPAPEVFCPADLEVFDIDPPVLLNEGTPAGGTYSGTGVFTDGDDFYFDPSTGIGVYEIVYCVEDVITGCSGCCGFVIEVMPIPGQEQVICMPAGWTGISSYFIPDNPQLETIFAELNADNKMVIMLGENGIYWPGQNINTLGNWDVYKGYKIKMNEAGCIEIEGEMPDDKSIMVKKGSSFIPVLCDQNVPAAFIFDQLGNDLLFAYDLHSQTLYWPQGGITTLEVLEPGKGYLVNMNEQGQFTYNCAKSNTAGYVAAQPPVYQNAPWSFNRSDAAHFISINTTALSELEVGDFIGVFNNDGTCAGFTQYNGEKSNLLLVAYGDDFTTDYVDGFTDLEMMSFRVFRHSTNTEMTVDVVFNASMPDAGSYREQGQSKIISIKSGASSIGEGKLSSIGLGPNPSNGLIHLTIPAMAEELTIEVANIAGQVVHTEKLDNAIPAHQLYLTAVNPGVYFVRITASDQTVVRKIVIQ